MYKHAVKTSVVGSSDLTGKEGYAVTPFGGLTTTGNFVYGIVEDGGPAGKASEVVVSGITEAYVNGGTTNIAAGDFLVPSATAGVLVKTTSAANGVRVLALEAATADGVKIKVLLF